MFRLFVLLLTVGSCFTEKFSYPKCCGSDSVLKKSSFGYNCTQDLTKRIQISLNQTNFLDTLETGDCVDVEESVSLFRSIGTDVIKLKDLDVNFYPKCCPIDYFYNTIIHGCVKAENLEKFYSESFVRVGLPECKIIVDITTDVAKHLENFNGSVYLNQRSRFAKHLHCVDKDQSNSFVVRLCHNDYDVCDKIRCIRKCCSDGQSFVNGSKCHNTYVYGLDLSSFSNNVENVNDTFAIVHDGHSSTIYPLSPERFNFYLDNDGVFSMTEIDDSLGKINVTRHYSVDQKIYCVEHALKQRINTYLFFRGFPQQTRYKFVYTGIAMVISCFFLLLTMLYYCFSNEKKTLFGKILISYCIASLLTFLLLSAMAFDNTRPKSHICTGIAFILFYLTLTIFTWMNVMCIDIYCTFGSSKSFMSRQYKSQEMKRFALYSLHGWGTPLVLFSIPLVLYHLENLPWSVQIVISMQKCFLFKGEGNYSQFIFSTIPISILQLCNLILFIKTVVYCLQVKKEINKMNDSHSLKGEKKQRFNKFRTRFGLLLKLFFIMGVSFLFEVVSTFYDFEKHEVTAIIETIWDTFNCLQGLFIFLIFILKKRIFERMEKKVGLKKLRKISFVSSALTQTTSLSASAK